MIPFSSSSLNRQNWQHELATAFTDLKQLLNYLELPQNLHGGTATGGNSFPLRVPRYFAGLMQKGNANDPLLLQVLPQALENVAVAGFSLDPLEDQQAHMGNGILKKYHGRALLITTASCAVHCRYCFRRHFPYQQHQSLRGGWQSALSRLASDPGISEVILSGGDPLSLSNERLADLIHGLERIEHIQRLRIHTRTPVVLPSRLDQGLIELLAQTRFSLCLVIHANHPAEVTQTLQQQLAPIRCTGITLLNQSVLLRNINDQLQTQVELCEKLFSIGVLPYYLHLLDKVEGAAHFYVSSESARQLHRSMQAILPGYLLPRLAQEIPGADSKQLLQNNV